MSVWPVVIQTLTPLGIGIIAVSEAQGPAAASGQRARDSRGQARRHWLWRTTRDRNRRRRDLNGNKHRRGIPLNLPSRANRRHVNNWLVDSPLRPAVTDTRRGPPYLSVTIRRFSSNIQRRQAPVETTLSRETFGIGIGQSYAYVLIAHQTAKGVPPRSDTTHLRLVRLICWMKKERLAHAEFLTIRKQSLNRLLWLLVSSGRGIDSRV